ncbi:MAG: hypothetical protein H6509_16005 [Bryobacterales bacterium]|nr:hypothetical protein [Bryobacterales bacterium]
MDRYPSLKDAVLDLDPVLIRTLAAFSIERTDEGLVTLFRFAFYGPNLERENDVDQYPDIYVLLPPSLDPKEEIQGLEESEIVGSFNILEMAPVQKWLVKTHAGSQAERIAWRNSIT